MRRSSRLVVFVGIVAFAVAAAVVLTSVFANGSDPAFQRALLRLLTIIGVVAIFAMCGSLLQRAETIDQLASQPVPSRQHRRR